MNTPQQQAELYRKAAETIEMCAEHGIGAKVKVDGNIYFIFEISFTNSLVCYEFPIAVIEGQLVWADTIVYNCDGFKIEAKKMTGIFKPYSLNQPKKPLCEVEGKPVYKGDKLLNTKYNYFFIADNADEIGVWEEYGLGAVFEECSWNPPKPKTVFIEHLIDDVRLWASFKNFTTYHEASTRLYESFSKALDNLKG